MMYDRDIDGDTLRFHVKQCGLEEFDRRLRGNSVYMDMSLEATFKAMTNFLEPYQEIWINHPSFDVPIFRSLCEETRWTKPLWYFRKEKDVATIRDVVPVQGQTKAEHEALKDAEWAMNLAIGWHRVRMLVSQALEQAAELKAIAPDAPKQ
jgi:hypothetical protein